MIEGVETPTALNTRSPEAFECRHRSPSPINAATIHSSHAIMAIEVRAPFSGRTMLDGAGAVDDAVAVRGMRQCAADAD